MAELVDHLLLGLVDCLVPLCRTVHRARIQGPDDSTVLSVCASGSGFGRYSVDGNFR